MQNRGRRLAIAGVSCALLAGTVLSGCGQVRSAGGGAGQATETAVSQSETRKELDLSQSESEIQPQTQKLITSVEYTSKDGTVKITLPDNTWKVTQDADEMRVFASGSEAMINIVHASTEASMKTLSIQTSKTNLETALTGQYSDSAAYQIESYDQSDVGNVKIYRYVVRYKAAARMWAYSVTYGIVAPDQAYVITGTITDDNQTLLKAVEDSVDSFSILRDQELKAVTDSHVNGGTVQPQIQTQKTGQTGAQTSAQEAASLSAYATQTTMYSNDIVNIRSGPGTDSQVMGSLTTGGKVTVTGETAGWYQVSVNGAVGYVRKDFLTTTQTATPSTSASDDGSNRSQEGAASDAEIATATNYGSTSTLYTTDGVNIRSNPGTGSSIVATLPTGSAVSVIGETDNWYIVSTGSGTGYISKSYLASSAPASTGGNGTSSGSGTSSAGSGSKNTAPTSGTSILSGTVSSATSTSVTIAGDDGNTYTIYTGDADITSSGSGLTAGTWISASVDNSQTASDGTRYATSVSGG